LSGSEARRYISHLASPDFVDGSAHMIGFIESLY